MGNTSREMETIKNQIEILEMKILASKKSSVDRFSSSLELALKVVVGRRMPP